MKAFMTLLAAGVVALSAAAAQADPLLQVTYEGVNGSGNNTWLIAVAPDSAFFVDTTSGFGSSLAVELAFAVDGSTILSTVENDIDWDFDNPGNNPFTGTVTDGMWINNPTNDRAFGAFGSRVFTTGDPVALFSMETLGSELTTVRYGVAASGHPRNGSVIAQAGQNFPAGGGTAGLAAQSLLAMFASEGGAGGGGIEVHEFINYSGSVNSIPEPATALMAICGILAGCVAHRWRAVDRG